MDCRVNPEWLLRTALFHRSAGGSFSLSDFYIAPQCLHCKRCTSYSNSVCLSVCPSVRLSHADIVPKRRHVAWCSLHCRIAKWSSFVDTKNILQGLPLPLKSWLQVTYPLLKAASFDTFCLVAPQS